MIKINRFLIVGGDLRNVELVKLLKEDGKEVYNYDRGLDTEPQTEEAEKALMILMKKYTTNISFAI